MDIYIQSVAIISGDDEIYNRMGDDQYQVAISFIDGKSVRIKSPDHNAWSSTAGAYENFLSLERFLFITSYSVNLAIVSWSSILDSIIHKLLRCGDSNTSSNGSQSVG